MDPRRLGTPLVFAVLILGSLTVHTRFTRPAPDPNIVGVNTNFGNETGTGAQQAERTIQQIALAHPNALLIFPESVIPDWSATHDARWADLWAIPLYEAHNL